MIHVAPFFGVGEVGSEKWQPLTYWLIDILYTIFLCSQWISIRGFVGDLSVNRSQGSAGCADRRRIHLEKWDFMRKTYGDFVYRKSLEAGHICYTQQCY
jgi:hypothetical protein